MPPCRRRCASPDGQLEDLHSASPPGRGGLTPSSSPGPGCRPSDRPPPLSLLDPVVWPRRYGGQHLQAPHRRTVCRCGEPVRESLGLVWGVRHGLWTFRPSHLHEGWYGLPHSLVRAWSPVESFRRPSLRRLSDASAESRRRRVWGMTTTCVGFCGASSLVALLNVASSLSGIRTTSSLSSPGGLAHFRFEMFSYGLRSSWRWPLADASRISSHFVWTRVS